MCSGIRLKRPCLEGALIVLLAASRAGAQTVQRELSRSDAFLGFTVDDFRDIAIGDGGEWLSVITTTPAGGPTVTKVIQRLPGPTDGMFTPGLVSNLSGAASTLLNGLAVADFFHQMNTITVVPLGLPHGLQVGEQVKLDFVFLHPGMTGPLPADGIFTVQTVPNPNTFTITHGTSGTCGSLPFAPCGRVDLVRTIQPVDLNYSLTCLPAYQGVLQMMDDDDTSTPPLITPTVNDSALFWNSSILQYSDGHQLREGQVSRAPQVSPNATPYNRIWRSVVDAQQDYLLLARMNDPAISGLEEALVFVDVFASCPPVLLSEQVLVRTGDPILNTSNLKFRVFASQAKHGFRLNNRGDFMYLAELKQANGLPSPESSVVVNNAAVISVSQQIQGLNGQITDLAVAAVDINDLGDYVAQIKAQTSPHAEPCVPQPPPDWCNPPPGQTCPTVYCFPSSMAILKGHADTGPVTKFIQEGDNVPDPSIPLTERMLRVGHKLPPSNPVSDPLETFPVFITNGGDVIWYGEWGHQDPETGNDITTGKAIFFNHKILVPVLLTAPQPNVPAVLDVGVSTNDVRATMEVSPNGRYLLFRGDYWDGMASRVPSLLKVDLGESVPYGTVATGCSYAYPTASLDCTPGLPLPGSGALGDYPLVTHNLQLSATSAPPGTVMALFAFKSLAHSSPCGSPPPIPVLLGSGQATTFQVPYSGSAVLTTPLHPAFVTPGQVAFCQAFFHNQMTPGPGTLLGATNGIRFVFGNP